MNLEQLKNSIANSTEQIHGLNLKLLYPSNPQVANWQNMTASEVKSFLEDTVFVLDELRNKLDLLNTVGYNQVNSIQTHLSNFVQHFGSVQNLLESQITNQHHQALNQIQAVNNSLRSTGLYTQVKFPLDPEKEIKTLRDAASLAKKLTGAKTNFESAIETAEEWMKQKDNLTEQILKKHATTFANRAEEHEGKYWWLIGALMFAVIAVLIILCFIAPDLISSIFKLNIKNNISINDISAGAAILRVSSLLIPVYFTLFFTQQFLYHKKLYEIYSFKDVALRTMTNLMNSHVEPMTTKILEKGLDVIFTEPSTKEGNRKYNEHLVSELLSMARKQVK